MQFPPFSGGPQSQHNLFLVSSLQLTFTALQVPAEQGLPRKKKKEKQQNNRNKNNQNK